MSEAGSEQRHGEALKGPLAPTVPLPASRSELVKRLVQALISLAVTVLLLGWLLPAITDTTWSQIFATIAGIGPLRFAGLTAMMLTGLYCYTFTLTGSLPGLRHGRALMTNLAGSGISNLFPGGGAFGTVLTFTMWRSWGFAPTAIGSSMIVTTVWNALIRAVLPMVAAVLLLFSPENLPTAIAGGAVLGAILSAVVVSALLAVLISEGSARRLGRVVNRLIRRFSPGSTFDAEKGALDLRAQTLDVVLARWHLLSGGLIGFFGVYYLLFWTCLHLSGVNVSWRTAFAAFAVGRLLSSVPLTPGGLGVSEAGTAAVLVAMGTEPAATGAGVALFAVFSYFLEIPFGAIAFTLWVVTMPGGWQEFRRSITSGRAAGEPPQEQHKRTPEKIPEAGAVRLPNEECRENSAAHAPQDEPGDVPGAGKH